MCQEGNSYELHARIGSRGTFINPMDWIHEDFRAGTEAEFKAYKKQKVIANWSLTQIGDHTGMVVVEFDTVDC